MNRRSTVFRYRFPLKMTARQRAALTVYCSEYAVRAAALAAALLIRRRWAAGLLVDRETRRAR